MSSEPESKVRLLQDQLPDDIPWSCPNCAQSHPNNYVQRFKDYAVFELVQVALFLLAYGAYVIFQSRSSENRLDSYWRLAEYNTTKGFRGYKEVGASEEGDKLWKDIQNSDGIVAVDTQWALQHGLSASMPHPYESDLSIYQIDVFHTIHCLYRIRNRLTSELPIDEMPRHDGHTLHCLDYVREQIMCHSDLVLEGTNDYIMFQSNKGHVCRDFDAVQNWALEHNWPGHRDYLRDVIGYNPMVHEHKAWEGFHDRWEQAHNQTTGGE